MAISAATAVAPSREWPEPHGIPDDLLPPAGTCRIWSPDHATPAPPRSCDVALLQARVGTWVVERRAEEPTLIRAHAAHPQTPTWRRYTLVYDANRGSLVRVEAR